MENYIIIAVVVLIVAAVIAYIVKAKKSGKKCIGCPDGGSCGKESSCCSCGCGGEKTEQQ